MLRDQPKTLLIIPCFNEAQRLQPETLLAFSSRHPDFGLCLVNDGSTDGTLALLNRLEEDGKGRVKVVDVKANLGKGNAVRCGALRSMDEPGCEEIGYWDADLATPLEEALVFRDVLRSNPECQLVCGCRLRRLGADITRRWHRHYLGRVFASLASLALGLPVYDSQCGAKLMTRALAGQVFAEPFLARWCFDVEILARMIRSVGRAGVRKAVIESPLRSWSDQSGSKLGFAHSLAALADLWRIRRKYL